MLCENVAIIDKGEILKEGSPKALTQELGKAGITVQLNHVPSDISHYLKKFTYTQENNRLHFVVKDLDSSMPKIIHELSKSDVHIQNISTNSSSLENVFLELTGKGINE